MDKIVGNKYFFLLLFYYFFLSAHIEINFVDMDDNPIKKIGVGQPFIIQVVADFAFTHEPELTVPAECYIQRSGLQMTTINGVTSVKHSYEAVINKVGMHKIGPATIKYGANQRRSDPVYFNVLPHTQSNNKNDDAFLRLTSVQDHAYVGQPIKIKATFYCHNKDTKFQHLEVPDYVDFECTQIGKPETGTENINGTDYVYAQWQWQLIPKNAGLKTIPAFRAEYEIPKRRRFIHSLWGYRTQAKRVYSNALQIEVRDLPNSLQESFIIGKNIQVMATMKPSTAKAGEGMVLMIAFDSEDLMNIKQKPRLKAVPKQLKWYDSKNTVYATRQEFEFIVQGLQEGQYEIPAQKFVYFDSDTDVYKTIETAPLLISILPGKTAPIIEQAIDTQPEHKNEQKIAPLEQNGPWYPQKERKPMAWWLFFTIFFAPFGIMLQLFIAKRFNTYADRLIPNRKIKRAFKQTKNELKKARLCNDSSAIYGIIMKLFSLRYSVPIESINNDFIVHKLKNGSFSPHEIMQWHEFFDEVCACTFAHHVLAEHLFDKTQKWIEKFEVHLK